MRISRWPHGDLDLEPGDMVRISCAADGDGVWAEVAVGGPDEEKSPSWIPSGPGPESQAMFLGEEYSEGSRIAQVLHGGRILNVLTKDIEPAG
jgi:hypothetical protein